MRTSRLVRGGALAVFLTVVSAAGSTESTWPVTRHSLWRIEGGRSVVYLLGAIHVMHREHYPLERPIEDAFDQARVVAFETEIGEARERLRARPAKAEPKKRTPTKPLAHQVSPETYAHLGRYLEGIGLPATAFDALPPWQAGLAVFALELRRLGYDPKWGVDNYYFDRATKYGKQTVGLETVDEHMSLMKGMSKPDADAYLEAMLEDAETLRQTLRDMVRAWKGGESDRLSEIINGSMHARPELRDRLLVDRNRRWVPKIEALADGPDPALVIVGAGHLVGPDSVVDLLQKDGRIVRQQ
jgi:uncharacterized protein YbaP (TraB family)